MTEETELKLDVSEEGLAALDASGLLGACSGEADLHAAYFDTPGLDLWRNRLSLRIRREGRRTLQTIKQPAVAGGGIAVRREWEMPVKPGEPPVPDIRTPVPALLEKHGGGLEPVFEVIARRRTWQLASSDTKLEIAIDQGEVIAGGRQAPFSEIEIELLEGKPDAVFALARRMDAVAPLRLGVLAKAERGIRLLETEKDAEEAGHVELSPDMPPAEAFTTIAHACLRQYRLNETILLARRSAEAVHQARVALRRLRSAMLLFRKLLPGEGTARLKDRIRALARTYGEARDFDVLAGAAEESSLRAKLESARDDAYTRLEAALAGDAARHLMIDLAEWLAIGAWRADPATSALRGMPLKLFAGKALDRLRRKVRRDGRHLAALGDEARHQFRKDVKKLRYGIEFLGWLFTGGKRERHRRKFLKALKKLQEELGSLNDLVTAESRFSALGLSETPEGERFLAAWRKQSLLRQAAGFRHDLLEEKPFWR